MNYENTRGDHVVAAIVLVFAVLLLWFPVSNGDLVLLTEDPGEAREVSLHLVSGGFLLLLVSLLIVFDQMTTPEGFLAMSSSFVAVASLTFVEFIQVFEPETGAFLLLIFGPAAFLFFVRSVWSWLSKDGTVRAPVKRGS